jgi:hypothetical protein
MSSGEWCAVAVYSSVRCGSGTGWKDQHQPTKGVDMTDDNKHDDKDRKRLSDEELKDVAGGGSSCYCNSLRRECNTLFAFVHKIGFHYKCGGMF